MSIIRRTGARPRLVRTFASFVGAMLVLMAMQGARPARADVPPPDACTAPGQPCTNAGPGHDQAGVCTESTCTRTVPAPDGGTMSMSYACNLCKVAGAGGDGGTGGVGVKPPGKGSDGCSMTGRGPAGAWGGCLSILFAGVGLLVSRLRRHS